MAGSKNSGNMVRREGRKTKEKKGEVGVQKKKRGKKGREKHTEKRKKPLSFFHPPPLRKSLLMLLRFGQKTPAGEGQATRKKADVDQRMKKIGNKK